MPDIPKKKLSVLNEEEFEKYKQVYNNVQYDEEDENKATTTSTTTTTTNTPLTKDQVYFTIIYCNQCWTNN